MLLCNMGGKRFLHQAMRQPTLTVQYSTKFPTAGPIEGSGKVDHIVTLLGSKDLPARFHLDAFGKVDAAQLLDAGKAGGFAKQEPTREKRIA
jgi:hypothetical protein